MKNILPLILIAVSFTSCRKDPNIPVSNATPYSINYPARISKYIPEMKSPVDNPLTVEGVELGRHLFFDKRLSADNTMSCASCHDPSTSFSDVVDLSVGIDGLPGKRNSMPLINLGWMNSLFWDGRSASLEIQAFAPVTDPVELHTTWPNVVDKLSSDEVYKTMFFNAFGTEEVDSVLISKAISQFERTLISGDSPMDKYMNADYRIGSSGWNEMDELAAYQGFALFMDEEKGDCFHCHGDPFNPLWTDNLFHNNV